jgi:Xaa-Pro aminopeptidase
MFDTSEFLKRRQRLFDQLEPGSVVVIASAKEQQRNNDVMFPFRQNSDFHYLTGFPEDNAVLVLRRNDQKNEMILFSKVQDPVHERWTGPIIGQIKAVENYGADFAYPIDALNQKMPELLADYHRIYALLNANEPLSNQILLWIEALRAKARSGVHAPEQLFDLRSLLHEMRLKKSSEEIKLMRTAAEITSKGYHRLMRNLKAKSFEYQLEAELVSEFTRHGARAQAYPPIVGSGKNSCILHYNDNNAPLNPSDLVLVDAGCEWEHYASDVTRTLPLSGRFSPEQKAIYELVLEAQTAVIAQVAPGIPFDKLQETAVQVITAGLVKLGILSGKVEQLMEDRSYARFYMHNIGHWIGLDVHDVGAYKINGEWRRLEPGIVLTVEPGIYISADEKGVAQKWWNIGVRIEDDVLVTSTGSEVLTSSIPKTVEEIESLISESVAIV